LIESESPLRAACLAPDVRAMAAAEPPAVPMLPLTKDLGIPAIGYGVGTAWFKAAGTEREAALQASVVAALDAGFRHLDEAEMYQNEGATGKAVGEWLARTGTPREQLFITSKVFNVDDPGVEAVCRRSLEAMGLTYFDLYLVHAPFMTDGTPFKKSLQDIWREAEGLVDAGLAKAIGVSNWRISDLEQVCEGARVKPVCNQLEAHPYLQQPKLLSWCQAHGILVTAYSPLGSIVQEKLRGGPVDAVVAKVAERSGKTPGQVLLRWNLQTGRGVLTTTSKPERLLEFLSIFDFELTAEEVAEISAAGSARQQRVFWKTMPADEP